MHRVRAFSAPHPPERRLGVNRELGVVTAGTADPSRPQGYSTPYGCILSMYSWGELKKKGGTKKIQIGGICLPKSLVCVTEPNFPGNDLRDDLTLCLHEKQ